MVAKAPAPPVRPPPARGKTTKTAKKKAANKPKPALPASVTMAADRVVRGEELPRELELPGAFWGVVYRFVIADANGRPIAPGTYKIRKHLLHVASSGCLAHEETAAKISVVTLDEEGASYDFSGVPVVAEMPATEGEARTRAQPNGKDETFEYFSFELQGVSYAIPQSGFALARSKRGQRLLITRSPQAGGSIHGAVVQGFVTEGGGDSFSFETIAG